MKLPGQKKSISGLLLKTVREVESRTGGHVKFEALPAASGYGGTSKRDPQNKVELISILPKLKPQTAEVIAAHELMHSLQRADGFCILETNSPRDGNGTLVFPWLPLLGSSIESMIQDPLADKWAIARGFDVKLVVKESDLPQLLKSYRSREPIVQDSAEWEIPGTNVQTLQWAFTYAGLRVRYSRLNLFNSELDRLLQNIAPVSIALGLQLVQVVDSTGCETRDQCEASVIAIMEKIRIDPRIIRVKQPVTDTIVWPRASY
jgi:hypothetical protein